jgi:hypothetical protein
MGIERSTEPCVVFVLALKSRDPPTPFEVAGIEKGKTKINKFRRWMFRGDVLCALY